MSPLWLHIMALISQSLITSGFFFQVFNSDLGLWTCTKCASAVVLPHRHDFDGTSAVVPIRRPPIQQQMRSAVNPLALPGGEVLGQAAINSQQTKPVPRKVAKWVRQIWSPRHATNAVVPDILGYASKKNIKRIKKKYWEGIKKKY